MTASELKPFVEEARRLRAAKRQFCDMDFDGNRSDHMNSCPCLELARKLAKVARKEE